MLRGQALGGRHGKAARPSRGGAARPLELGAQPEDDKCPLPMCPRDKLCFGTWHIHGQAHCCPAGPSAEPLEHPQLLLHGLIRFLLPQPCSPSSWRGGECVSTSLCGLLGYPDAHPVLGPRTALSETELASKWWPGPSAGCGWPVVPCWLQGLHCLCSA